MIKTIALVLLLVIAAILVYATTKPDSFRVERATNIKAPAEKIFPFIDDFHHWQTWSPWEKIDPNSKRTYSGASNGIGAVYEWSGNKDVGQGRMEIIESLPSSKMVMNIDFIKPFEGHNKVEFTLTAQGDSTKVTQAMYGRTPYIGKVMSLFFSMDKMVGEKYEEGLATLKAVAEK
jgi:Polyketide cyclase / dehydrase and lipid transport